MPSNPPIQVGQKLWYVPSRQGRGGDPFEVTVKSVGRLFLEMKGKKSVFVHRETLVGYKGRCYRSKSEWETEVAVRDKWMNLLNEIEATIAQIRALLFPAPNANTEGES